MVCIHAPNEMLKSKILFFYCKFNKSEISKGPIIWRGVEYYCLQFSFSKMNLPNLPNPAERFTILRQVPKFHFRI